jgi:hypothetical protein
MQLETLPAGSELLLLVCAIAGLSTWYLSNFTDRVDLTKLAAFVGVCSMVTLVFWVFF